MPLLDVVQVAGAKKIFVETVNDHMAMSDRLGDEAKRHERVLENVFDGMKIKKPKGAKTDRKSYTSTQTE